MDNETFLITPPIELVQQWWTEFERADFDDDSLVFFATQAARWGADQELEACCEYISRWFATPEYRAAELRSTRRPKPPSLKEQALEALDQADKGLNESEWQQRSDTIRRALEQLDD